MVVAYSDGVALEPQQAIENLRFIEPFILDEIAGKFPFPVSNEFGWKQNNQGNRQTREKDSFHRDTTT